MYWRRSFVKIVVTKLDRLNNTQLNSNVIKLVKRMINDVNQTANISRRTAGGTQHS